MFMVSMETTGYKIVIESNDQTLALYAIILYISMTPEGIARGRMLIHVHCILHTKRGSGQ